MDAVIEIFLIIFGVITLGLVLIPILTSFLESAKDFFTQPIIKKRELEKLKKKRYDDLAQALKKEYDELLRALESDRKEVEEKKQYYEDAIEKIDTYCEQTMKRVEDYIKEKCSLYPHLAGLMSDFLLLHYEKSAHFLESKAHPALVEAQRIKELKAETAEYVKQFKVLEYKLAYLRWLFPNLDDLFDNMSEEGFRLEPMEENDTAQLYAALGNYWRVKEEKAVLERKITELLEKLNLAHEESVRLAEELESTRQSIAPRLAEHESLSFELNEQKETLQEELARCERAKIELTRQRDVFQAQLAEYEHTIEDLTQDVEELRKKTEQDAFTYQASEQEHALIVETLTHEKEALEQQLAELQDRLSVLSHAYQAQSKE